jgi:hypothetical protein
MGERSEIIVMDLIDVVRDDAYQRGLDPVDLEIVDSRITDDDELCVQVRASSHYQEGDCSE